MKMGIIVGLLLSWLLLWFVQKESLLALGFTPVATRVLQLISGFSFSSILCASLQVTEASFMNAHWQLNPQIDVAHILNYLWWNLNSVMFEELLFRGALLFIAIKKLGVVRGVILSSICFGIYHWFSFEVVGNIIPMVVIFIITGLMGAAWAYAFAKTKSMALPIGFHLGWNFTFNAIFSKGFISLPVFMLVKNADSTGLSSFVSLTNFLLQNILPSVLTFLFVRFYIKETTPVEENKKEEIVANLTR
jgi:uncharacterized protein